MNPETHDPNKETLKTALDLMPTEMRCFDESTPGTAFTDLELQLAELEPKVERYLHGMAGNAVAVMEQPATPEEVARFAELLREKAAKYSELAGHLETISKKD